MNDPIERQTIEEIEAQFPSERGLILDPETDQVQHLLAGRVLFHSRDRDEVDCKLLEVRPPRFALRYLGDFPEHIATIL